MILMYKVCKKLLAIVANWIDYIRAYLLLKCNGVSFQSFRTSGVPYVMVARGGRCSIGKGFAMNNGIKGNPIGCNQRCTLFVDRAACLCIGDNVGISQAALVAIDEIVIGDNVKIGGGTCVYTTDFHALDPIVRASGEDQRNRKRAPVVIERNAFIGAKCIILKGVTIGENSIVGAGAVVTKSVPANQIWAGNPARFVREL